MDTEEDTEDLVVTMGTVDTDRMADMEETDVAHRAADAVRAARAAAAADTGDKPFKKH